MSEPEAQLKKLVIARGHSKQSITRIANFLANEDQVAKVTRQLLITKKDRLVEVFATYSEQCNEIEVLDPSDKESYDDIEDRYLDALAKLNSLIFDFATTSSDTATYKSVEESRSRHTPRHNLPQIKIPKFNGSLGNYHDYINLFTSVIHSEIGLSQCDKLYYLRSTLEGEAADIVKHLTLSSENYEVALRLLKERYDNKTKIVTFHVNSILDLRPISRCTSEQLRDLVSKTKQHLGALKNHNIPTDYWDTIIVAILQRKLDQYSLRSFHLEAHRENNELPTLDSLLKFIEQRAAALETVAETNDNKTGTDSTRQSSSKGSVCKSMASTRSSSPSLAKCRYCDSTTHKIFSCEAFKLLSSERRLDFVESKKLCTICLNEHARKCRYYFKCAICKERHNTLLHIESTDRSENILDNTNTVTLAANDCKNILLPTVRVKLSKKDGSVMYARALLDSGSQVSFITSELADLVKCELYQNNFVVKGVCGGLNNIQQKAKVRVSSTSNNFNLSVDCCIVKKITSDLPQFKVNKRIFNIPSHIQLADRDFNKCEQIGILLGCDIFFQALEREQVPLISGNLFLQNTRFGYVVAGNVPAEGSANFNEACNLTIDSRCNRSRYDDLKSLTGAMGQFWRCEDVKNDGFETITPEQVSDAKTCNVSNDCESHQDNIFNRYSDIKKMKRVVAYLKRFIENCRRKVEDRSLGNLSPSELYGALLTIVRYEQRKYFDDDIRCLLEGKQLKSSLGALKPFLNGMGLMRVGGRLQNADLTYDQKYPIILPKGSTITHYIIENEHKNLLHAGQRLVLSNLNQRFYIINGLREVKRVIHKCIICFKLKAKNAEQLMGSLPTDRVRPARVFETVGIDYGGPFNVEQHRVRKPIIYKTYIVLFVCFVTKAVHIELVTDMTTECFLICLKRFMARRNKPSIIYCDNASTFKGAQNELNRLYQLNSTTNHQYTVQSTCADLGIKFKFIPAYSPVFGGLWEAGIKGAKYHIKRVVGTTVLTYEEMNTVMIQVEAVLNSRPLTALSTDPNDMTYLTPAHFLTGASLTAYPEPNLRTKVSNRLTFWKQCTKMLECFWEQWRKQYLVQLQNRPKWRTESPNISIGSLVLLKDDNCPPLCWPTARVVETFPGKDGLVRALSVRTSKGTLIRTSVGKVCVLPIQ